MLDDFEIWGGYTRFVQLEAVERPITDADGKKLTIDEMRAEVEADDRDR